MKSLRIKIYGKVQGVFFRAYTQEKAQKLNLTGWAKNEPDGTVLIEAQGEKEALEKFLKWCRQGSPHSQVEEIETEWQEAETKHKDFSIRY